MAISLVAVGDSITAATINAIIQTLTSGFTGTPLFGTFDSTKPVYHMFAAVSGTSDAVNGLFTVTIPTATSILSAAMSPQAAGSSMTTLITGRPSLFTSTGVVFQTHNFAGTAVVSTVYNVSVDVAYQA